jgi:hypothetical protein
MEKLTHVHVYKILTRKPDGKRPLGRPRHGWEYSIKKNLKEIGGKISLTRC